MNTTGAIPAELATGTAGSLTAGNPPSDGAHSGPIAIRHSGREPSIHPAACVAPTAELRGQVSTGAGSCAPHRAMLAAEGGPVRTGTGCLILENAVPRGTARHPLLMGDRVLTGPHARPAGCVAANEGFTVAGKAPLAGAAGPAALANRAVGPA
jgi:hypothetical protein